MKIALDMDFDSSIFVRNTITVKNIYLISFLLLQKKLLKKKLTVYYPMVKQKVCGSQKRTYSKEAYNEVRSGFSKVGP